MTDIHIRDGDVHARHIGDGDITSVQVPWETFIDDLRPEIDPWLALVAEGRSERA